MRKPYRRGEKRGKEGFFIKTGKDPFIQRSIGETTYM
jgi:hypothetical protein